MHHYIKTCDLSELMLYLNVIENNVWLLTDDVEAFKTMLFKELMSLHSSSVRKIFILYTFCTMTLFIKLTMIITKINFKPMLTQ